MDVYEAIRTRRSIRAYNSNPIPKGLLDKLKQAVIWAPSAGNLQARKFYFVTNTEKIKKIVNEGSGQAFIKQAPFLVIACCNCKQISTYGDRGKEIYTVCDVAAAVENMMLQAVELGLGTCWVGSIDEGSIREILDIPEYIKPISIIPVGYPAESPSPTERDDDQVEITT